MRIPVISETLHLQIKGKSYPVTCTDVFDGGFGYYFDVTVPKTMRYKFKPGEQCPVPELGPKCVVDFVSYSPNQPGVVRFLVSKGA